MRLFQKFPDLPTGLSFFQKLKWRFMPGVTIRVQWPYGTVILHENSDGSIVTVESADPNDHYRPFLEKNVGKQGTHWMWGLCNHSNDVYIIIWITKSQADTASYLAIKWR